MISNWKGLLLDLNLLSFMLNLVHFMTRCFVYFCSLAQGFQSQSEFVQHLAASVDIVFPVIHGRFGEDGGVQVCLKMKLG